MRMRSLAAGLAMAAVILASLADPASAQCRKKSKPLVIRTYPVADLVVPINMDHCSGKPFDDKTTEDQLMELIRTTVAPNSWLEQGGKATLQYYPVGLALVINQTAAVHEEIQDLLAALRRLQSVVEVAVEVRLVHLRPEVLKVTGLDPMDATSPILLNDRQVKQFFEVAQNDRATCVMQSPKVTLFNNQRSFIQVTDAHTFTDPEHPAFTGLFCKLRPVATADRGTVHLSIDLTLADQITAITTAPRVLGFNVAGALKIPDGQTAVLFAGKETDDLWECAGNPLYWGRENLKRVNDRQGNSTRLVVLVTPHVVVREEEEQEVLDHGTLPPIPRR